MTRNCWRTMACLLCVALGGIVVWAEEFPHKQAGVAHAEPSCHAAPQAEPHVAAACHAVPQMIPAPVTPIQPDPDAVVGSKTTAFAAPPPAPAAVVPVAAAIPEPPPVAPPMPMPPMPVVEVPPIPVVPQAPPAVFVVEPPPAPPAPPAVEPYVPPSLPVARAVTIPTPPPAPPVAQVVVESKPLPPISPPAPPVAPALTAFPWKLSLEIVAGVNQLEIRRGDELLLRIQCERLDMQSPLGGLHATGKVVVTGPTMEARCDRLMIAWQTGQVALEGHVRMVCVNNGAKQEIGAESLCLRLLGTHSSVEFTPRDVTTQLFAPSRRD